MLLNLVLHLFNSLLWASIVERLNPKLTLTAGCLFAAHPMATDAVASVAGRSALLAGFVLFSGLLTAFYWPKLGLIGGFVLLILSMGMMPSAWFSIEGLTSTWEHIPRFISALGSYVFPRLFAPLYLTADPDIVYSGLALCLGMAVLLVASQVILVTHSPALRWGLAMAVLPLLPYALVPLPDVFFDHRAYIALAGSSLLMAYVFSKVPRGAIVLVCAFMVLTYQRVSVYATPIALWEDAVSKAPYKFRPHINLAHAYGQMNRADDTERELRAALQIDPNSPIALRNLAAVLLFKGDAQGAYEIFQTHAETIGKLIE